MSVNKLGITLLSGFLIFATALTTPAQSTTPPQDQSTKKQTTAHKDTASKDDIRTAQQALKDKGTYTGPVDGTMNAETKKALRDFQQKNNLEATGTLNHETMTALGVTPHPSTKGKDTSKTGTPGATTPKKEKGAGKPTSGVMKGKVREVQAALEKKGFDPGPVDGIMGPKTMTALRNFQSHNGLEVTGTINTETKKALMASAGTTSRSKPGTKESEPAPATPKDHSGASSVEDVRRVQQALTDLGYAPGELNGMMTSKTRQAIREFQFFNNLPVTGNLDEQTKAAIDAQERGGVGSTNSGNTYSPIARGVFTLVAQTSKATKEKYSSKSDEKESERIAKATEVLQDFTTSPDKKIPNELMERAEAVAVIPNVVKGAFGIGGRYGKGVISQRLPNGRWSAPAFLQIGGGSFGAQLGVSSTDLVLVFTDRKALSLLEGGKDLKIGADASAVAGPIGRSAEAGTNIKLESAIYSYSRSKGLFAGVALDGAVLSIDKDKNAKVYGASADARDILNGKIAANATVQPFVNALEKVSPKKRISQK
jgi:lipid-binding SYLF domain-containing protein/peptidoglycan hydrolase-like protein with peptidoglycan-binding domain